jgi:hypothetical protein
MWVVEMETPGGESQPGASMDCEFFSDLVACASSSIHWPYRWPNSIESEENARFIGEV